MSQAKIRNFCIAAHIDHGKSTLADRFLEITKTVDKRHLVAQTLDSMELEREKGITIKLKAVRMEYRDYQLNLIDTPGHVDFSYEVSRSLAACEGAILVVDATQGIQAQTVSNVYKAMDAGLTIIPVLNKIDLINAEVDKVADDLEQTFGFAKSDILTVSAKTGQGVAELLEKIIEKVPAPQGSADKFSRALIFDNYYNEHLGVVALIKVVDGSFNSADLAAKRKMLLLATNTQTQPEELGILKPQRIKASSLNTGEVGYIATGLKDIHRVKVGDTLCWADEPACPLPGYKEVKPFVFVSIFPVENDKFPQLRDALEKLALSDSALTFEPESSSALGFGFKCGFLGLLHADIVQERLEREYNLGLISTTPTVEYKVYLTDGQELSVKTASDFPEAVKISRVEEPWILVTIVSPTEYTGGIITLCQNRRALLKKMDYPTETRVVFVYELPLAELIHNFFDELKTVSSGFASVDYEFLDYKPVDAVKMTILVHGTTVSPLTQIVLTEKAVDVGQKMLIKLKDVIPRQQFEVALQAAIGGKIIAREDIPAIRKNVLAKMSGGHRERKDKLLDIQKKGKARMKRIGKVDIPQEAFRQVLT
ncbi:translation elongation factor 4 [Patescibacteria group bacterium]|nr:translation elongation factor 4 [Patescibacteria group bacterium]